MDDLDASRCRREFAAAAIEDLRWLGLGWDEGPDVGGPFAPYEQSRRIPMHAEAFERLRAAGKVYPCTCSRKDIHAAASAPHEAASVEKTRAEVLDDEPVYPGTCRPENLSRGEREQRTGRPRAGCAWRFRVPDGDTIGFPDVNLGARQATAGVDFGDFVVWRRDDLPSYQLACAVDEGAMQITEVVRGADLVHSTFRQLLILRALGLHVPAYFHCPLVTDATGARLAKRHDSLSIRSLRNAGWSREDVLHRTA